MNQEKVNARSGKEKILEFLSFKILGIREESEYWADFVPIFYLIKKFLATHNLPIEVLNSMPTKNSVIKNEETHSIEFIFSENPKIKLSIPIYQNLTENLESTLTGTVEEIESLRQKAMPKKRKKKEQV
ncbi:hypothetical protein HN954_00390 [bacterium]|nr:hypothetical protein [bacterium]MBT6995872.1 hypothetical protein [bacterium]